MSTTSDRNDPRLTRGIDSSPTPQAEVYLVLSDAERAKGFVRPVRYSYVHVGQMGPSRPLRNLTDEESERYAQYNYVAFEEYDDDNITGRFWTQEKLDSINQGCGVETTMNAPLAETYARNPSFYGATYCVGCMMHLAVSEFVWANTTERVGS